ncbi:helix-turn-helix domain-containing protein [Roseibium litorale]|uniref:Helix-turn-helix domain-containing protein n=1 Tax=Roseibium litorale TaxID=2803841 RepID=A0ABR9CUH3_9HYPH|nr:helix-turn-helix domain-containing protein [Roseibium litorale]MBD8894025.1 helix-turn-helix domain-containing protein [Roseibium litorale]
MEPSKGPRLSKIPAGAVLDPNLKHRDIRVLALLGISADRAGYSIRSQVKMARELGVGRTTIQRALAALVAAGWIEWLVNKRPDGGACSHTYRILQPGHGQAAQGDLLTEGAGAPEWRKSPPGIVEGQAVPIQRGSYKNGSSKTKEDDSPSRKPETPERGKEDGTDSGAGEQQQRQTGGQAQGQETEGEARFVTVAARRLKSLGLDIGSARFRGGASPLRSWFRAGCDLELDVIPAVNRVLARAPEPPYSLNYFSKAVFAGQRSRLELSSKHPKDFLSKNRHLERERRAEADCAAALAALDLECAGS